MDSEKVSGIIEWEKPTTIQDVQCFLGFANFYCRFIEEYSRFCTPLFNLLKTVKPDNLEPVAHKKGANKAPIEWTPTCQQVFKKLKSRFCSTPICKYFNPTLDTILETDASDYIVPGILS